MSKKIRSDVAIIGGGPGGYMAASRASQLGAKVTLVEKDELGGTCINRGCIPTKALIHVGHAISESRQLDAYNVHLDYTSLNFSSIMKEANSIAGEARGQVDAMMEASGVEVLKGVGRILDKNTVAVSTDEEAASLIDSSNIIIATGSSPLVPPIPGVHNEGVITSDDIFNHYDQPERIVIIGAGAVGLELGAIYNSIGSEVTIVEMMPDILPQEDEEITMYLRDILEEDGIHIFTDSRVNEIIRMDNELTLDIEGGMKVKGDLALLATGRVPNSRGIGLEGLVEMRRGFVIVDDHMRTQTENIFAVGDVVGRGMLAHVALHEGLVAGENAAGGDALLKYDVVPRCVYTTPEIACVGLSEEEARVKIGGGVKIVRCPLRSNGRAMTMRKTKGFIKLVYQEKTREILGAQILAPNASELIEELCLSMNVKAKLEDIASTIHAHPTLSEIIWDASLRGLR